MIGNWNHPTVIAPNNFKNKSLSNWSLNIAVGCAHKCLFCYVPSVSTRKLGKPLAALGVSDPDAQWGDYVFLRQWDEKKFLASLKSAEETPVSELAPDGNRAVMLCTTTDPYQVTADRDWNDRRRQMVRLCLTLIRDKSTLNVRILTRGPLAREDFSLMKTFGNRLMFGMSLPTLNNQLSRVFEPKAPAPTLRLETLQRAKDVGLNIYVAVAPTYPGDERGVEAVFKAISTLEPLTVFTEPINIRAENVERIRRHAAEIGVPVNLSEFETNERWRHYAFHSLCYAYNCARDAGLTMRLHLWPDASLQQDFNRWPIGPICNAAMTRVSEWPK